MQKLKLALLGGAMLVSGASFADHTPGHSDDHHHHVWHCTAYAEGHGHDPRFSASATHHDRSIASSHAMIRCERRTGHHCHHVDCHPHHH